MDTKDLKAAVRAGVIQEIGENAVSADRLDRAIDRGLANASHEVADREATAVHAKLTEESNPYRIKLEEIIVGLSADTLVGLGAENPPDEDEAFDPAAENAFADHSKFMETAVDQLADHVYRGTREYLESQVSGG